MNREIPDWAGLYDVLLHAYGPQNWWPGSENPFEVIVGAILTQRTTWMNASKAIDALRQAGALTPEVVLGIARSFMSFMVDSLGRRLAMSFMVRSDRFSISA